MLVLIPLTVALGVFALILRYYVITAITVLFVYAELLIAKHHWRRMKERD